MDAKPKCYITYCHEDISVEKMTVIVNWMTELCDHRIDFRFDNNVKYDFSFEAFEEEIYSVDAIIIFFTPKYRERCLDDADTGVAREYRKILSVFEDNKRLQQDKCDTFIKDRKIIYSVLYKGEPRRSITCEFLNYRYLDMSEAAKFREDKNHSLVLTEGFVSLYADKIQEFFEDVVTSRVEKTKSFAVDYEKMFKHLFLDTKGEHISLPNEIFVETDAYKNIVKQQKYLIIGRKGSGKTTVKNTISTIAGEQYKGIISIIADQFSTDETYQVLFKNEKISSDIDNYFSKSESYRIIWSAFINIYCIYIVYKEYLTHSLSKREQLSHIMSQEQTILGIFESKKRVEELDDETVTNTIYFHVLTNLERYIDHIVEKSRDEIQFFQTDIKSRFTSDSYLKFLIGQEAYDDFYYITKLCNKKILVTLDGFDTKFELFKKTTLKIQNEEERNRRIEFENLWLMIFFETLIDLKFNSKLKNIADLCLTVPVDRIVTIKDHNRDFFKYHSNTIALSWSSSDLHKLIVYRLRYMNSLNKIDENIKVDDVMEKLYSGIPKVIQMDRNGYFQMPLFLYVLRKSFWRPRDVIRYYGCIMTLRQNQKELNNISMKRVIKDESLRIIQDEFFGEFTNLYTNLKEIVNLFMSKKQILTYDELYAILKNKDFVIDENIIEKDFVKKVQILYVIGFLGINPPKNIIESQCLFGEYAFVFTEGTSILRILRQEQKCQCRYVIHPIFVEYLFLNVDYNTLVCNYTWEYVNNINCGAVDYILFEE